MSLPHEPINKTNHIEQKVTHETMELLLSNGEILINLVLSLKKKLNTR